MKNGSGVNPGMSCKLPYSDTWECQHDISMGLMKQCDIMPMWGLIRIVVAAMDILSYDIITSLISVITYQNQCFTDF
jgi:hypothetical protein